MTDTTTLKTSTLRLLDQARNRYSGCLFRGHKDRNRAAQFLRSRRNANVEPVATTTEDDYVTEFKFVDTETGLRPPTSVTRSS